MVLQIFDDAAHFKWLATSFSAYNADRLEAVQGHGIDRTQRKDFGCCDTGLQMLREFVTMMTAC